MTVRAARMPLTLTLESFSQTAAPAARHCSLFLPAPPNCLGLPISSQSLRVPSDPIPHTTPCCPSSLSGSSAPIPSYSLPTCTQHTA